MFYFPSEGRHAVNFFAGKIRLFQPVSNLQSWVPEASMLTTRPPKCSRMWYTTNITCNVIWRVNHHLLLLWKTVSERLQNVRSSQLWRQMTARSTLQCVHKCIDACGGSFENWLWDVLFCLVSNILSLPIVLKIPPESPCISKHGLAQKAGLHIEQVNFNLVALFIV
jgi:hypothetical protein